MLIRYSVETIPPDKSPRIWGLYEESNGHVLRPLVNLRKPKNMDDEEFKNIPEAIELNLKK